MPHKTARQSRSIRNAANQPLFRILPIIPVPCLAAFEILRCSRRQSAAPIDISRVRAIPNAYSHRTGTLMFVLLEKRVRLHDLSDRVFPSAPSKRIGKHSRMHRNLLLIFSSLMLLDSYRVSTPSSSTRNSKVDDRRGRVLPSVEF